MVKSQSHNSDTGQHFQQSIKPKISVSFNSSICTNVLLNHKYICPKLF